MYKVLFACIYIYLYILGIFIIFMLFFGKFNFSCKIVFTIHNHSINVHFHYNCCNIEVFALNLILTEEYLT